MRRLIVSTLLALALIVVLALPAAAGEQRPMHGTFSGSGLAVEQRCGPDALTVGFSLDGVGTHMGRLSGVGTNCTLFTLATEAVPIYDGIAVLAAAEGSTLTAVSEGWQDAPIGGVATFTDVHTVVGGTGRFAGAAGVITVTGTFDLSTFAINGTFAGWLSY